MPLRIVITFVLEIDFKEINRGSAGLILQILKGINHEDRRFTTKTCGNDDRRGTEFPH